MRVKILLAIGILSISAVFIAFLGTTTAQEHNTSTIDKAFFKTETEHCTITASSSPKWNMLRIDMTHKVVKRNCALTKEETVQIFSAIFETHKDAHKQIDDKTTYESFMIGRVENYGWMQHFLTETARKDGLWSKEMAKTSVKTNPYVEHVLSSHPVIGVFNSAGEKYGYSFNAISCEKVFISNEGFPTDAFCWAVLTPK